LKKLTNKSAHEALKKINAQRNLIGVGGYRDSRRARCDEHEKLNTAMNEINSASDKVKMESDND
jgi:hypothetical protein